MHDPSYPSKIALVSLWFRMISTPILTQVYEDSFTLTYAQDFNI